MTKSQGIYEIKNQEEWKMKFYKCDVCGNMVDVVKASGVPMM
ncbi:MAG: hypothetical protein IJ994_07295 [Firmicutes bacterium]|nr:hypothetical protein [Bacillota bacterium]